MTRDVVVVTAGLSVPSTTRLLADRLAAASAAAIETRGGTPRITVIELRELAVDLAAALTTGGLASPALALAREQVAAADGLIAVTPVFSGSYSGLFKMFFDLLDPGTLEAVPVLLGATAGTPRHALVLDHAMRPLFSYLHAVVVPTGVFAATEDFGGDVAGLSDRVDRAAAQLADLLVTAAASATSAATTSAATATPVVGRTARTAARPTPGTTRPDPAAPAQVVPFMTLLRGHAG